MGKKSQSSLNPSLIRLSTFSSICEPRPKSLSICSKHFSYRWPEANICQCWWQDFGNATYLSNRKCLDCICIDDRLCAAINQNDCHEKSAQSRKKTHKYGTFISPMHVFLILNYNCEHRRPYQTRGKNLAQILFNLQIFILKEKKSMLFVKIANTNS